jgi:acetoacetyl-CoA synthetase
MTLSYRIGRKNEGKISRGISAWQPSAATIRAAKIDRLHRLAGAERGLRFADYDALWRWSVDDLEGFWAASGTTSRFPPRRRAPRPGGCAHARRAVVPRRKHELRRPGLPPCHGGRARPSSRATKPASIASWAGPNCGARSAPWPPACVRWAWARRPRGRPTCPTFRKPSVAFLAVASIGAIWSACSPDMGRIAVLDRFRQIAPKVMIAVDGYRYGGKAARPQRTAA